MLLCSLNCALHLRTTLGEGGDSLLLRSLLGPQDDHCFVFMSTVGTPLSETYFSTYLASLVELHTGNRPTASVLRSSFVTSMLNGEAGADMRSREALAKQMRHSTREQLRTYDRRSRQLKKRRALEMVWTAPKSTTSAVPVMAPYSSICARRCVRSPRPPLESLGLKELV
jgi:hypothetical protein